MSDDGLVTGLEAAGRGEAAIDVGAAVRTLRAAFTAGGLESGLAEARMLVGHVLDLDLTGLTLRADRKVEAEAAARIVALGRRRLAGEPVQRLIGSAGFHGLDFRLSAETLVPRHDTETLVEVILGHLPADRAVVFADLGVGSGAILVSVLAERPKAFGIGTDVSAQALATARDNAEANGVAERAGFVLGSYAAALAAGVCDAIVSNPPYIASAEIETLDREVRLHDPRRALDGGADGLDGYRELVPQAAKALRAGGILAVEIGWRQGPAVARLFADHGFEAVTVTVDLAGRDRVVNGRSATFL